jgi:hypothetical protein
MQRLGQAVVFLIVFIGVGLVLFKVAAPRVLPPVSTSSDSVLPPAPGSASSAPTVASAASPSLASAPIATPRTASQREADDLEARRAPYYRWLHTQFGEALAAQQVSTSDAATLDLTMNRADPSLVLTLLGQAVQPYADRYGFNHVRFFQPNPPGSVERYRFAAEASPTANGAWQAFEK